MVKAMHEDLAAQFQFYAIDPKTHRLDEYGDDLDMFVTKLYSRHWGDYKDWALEQCKDKGAPFKKVKFKIELRHLDYERPKVPCLCLEAGFFDIPLSAIYGAKIYEVEKAFRGRHETLKKLNKPGDDDELEYCA